MLKKIMIITFISFILISAVKVSAVEIPETIRIGLKFGQAAPSEVVIETKIGFRFMDKDYEIYKTGGKVRLVCGSGSSIIAYEGETELFTYGEGRTVIEVVALGDNETIKFNKRSYRGTFELLRKDENSNITVINHLGMEEYLYSVVPGEMVPSWHIEALKAQAVCARTYAVSHYNKYKAEGFNLTDDTRCQMYEGVAKEQPSCNRSVDETKGMIVTYAGNPAQTLYISASSGHTLNSKDVWGGELAYLKGVSDSYQAIVLPDAMAWSVKMSPAQLKGKLAAKNVSIGEINNIYTEYSLEGAVTKLTIIGTEGEKSYLRTAARDIFSFRSQTYTVKKLGGETYLKVLGDSESREVLLGNVNVLGSEKADRASGSISVLNGEGKISNAIPAQVPEHFLFEGNGFGHGVGMSQYGAWGMAVAGYTFDQIIAHYYPGTVIEQREDYIEA